MIDYPTIERIQSAAQIYDVVSDFVNLRKRGVSYVGLCPFHEDRKPSFYVSPAKNIFRSSEASDPPTCEKNAATAMKKTRKPGGTAVCFDMEFLLQKNCGIMAKCEGLRFANHKYSFWCACKDAKNPGPAKSGPGQESRRLIIHACGEIPGL